MLNLPIAPAFLKAAYGIGGLPSAGQLAMVAVLKQRGPEAAWQLGETWAKSRPSPCVIGFTGVLALDSGERERASQLLELGKSQGDDPGGMLDILEFNLAEWTGDPSIHIPLAQEFEGRRDLPPLLSKLILTKLLWFDLVRGRLEEVRRRAGVLLSIEANPDAEMALWAAAVRAGDMPRAETHRQRAGGLAPSTQAEYEFLTYSAMGDSQRAGAIGRELDAENADGLQGAVALLQYAEACP